MVLSTTLYFILQIIEEVHSKSFLTGIGTIFELGQITLKINRTLTWRPHDMQDISGRRDISQHFGMTFRCQTSEMI